MNKFIRQNRGFSLIEMLLYIVLATIVVSIITVLAIWAIRIGVEIKNNQALSDNARRAMETMVYEIRQSKSVYLPTTSFSTDTGQLSLEQDTSTSPAETISYVDFFRCGSSLCLKRDGQIAQTLTNDRVDVTGLTFIYLENSSAAPSIKINLKMKTVSAFNHQSDNNIEITTTARLNLY